YSHSHHLPLPSFPTRRSSDLSMVVTRLPSTACIRVTQDRVAWPSRCTVQEPHIAIPQPYFVPVSLSFSRSTHSNVSSGCTATSIDRKSTRLNSSHQIISYAVF